MRINLNVLKKKKSLFVIGDSISMGYGPFLHTITKEFFLYQRKGGVKPKYHNFDDITDANGGDSSMVLAYLVEKVKDKSFTPDVLLLNAGLHDIKTDPATNTKQISPENYKKNLLEIVRLIKNRGICSVWINTTPVNDEVHNSKKSEFHRFNQDVLRYNQISENILSEKKWPIIDLYSFTSSLDCPLYQDHVHFFEDVSKMQAAFILGFLLGLDF